MHILYWDLSNKLLQHIGVVGGLVFNYNTQNMQHYTHTSSCENLSIDNMRCI